MIDLSPLQPQALQQPAQTRTQELAQPSTERIFFADALDFLRDRLDVELISTK
jgi:hypothetical protein